LFEVTFPGGLAVEAKYRGHSVRTDQPSPIGADSAMSPFDLFFASIATCMGFYALRFCQERGLSTSGLGISLTPLREDTSKRVTTVQIEVKTPAEFPEKYRAALLRAVDLCTVKRHILEPPKFEISLE
jgi:putative redox protein